MSDSSLKYRYQFDPTATNNTAATVASFVLSGGPDVLDIGSGPAWVSRYLAAEQGRRVTCVDNDPDALEALRTSETGLTAVAADLEDPQWYADLVGSSWDVVVLADVLEHLRRPDVLLTALLEHGLLRPDGHLVISVPNASHQSVVAELALGDMRYTETGILDETHVRWFTATSLERLLERCGFVVDRVARTRRPLRVTPTGERARELPAGLLDLLEQGNPDSDVYQVVVRARVAGETSRLVALREEADEAKREAHRLALELERARALLVNERRQFEAGTRRGAEELARAVKQARQLGRELARTKGDLERATNQLARVRERKAGVTEQRDRARERLQAAEAALAGRPRAVVGRQARWAARWARRRSA